MTANSDYFYLAMPDVSPTSALTSNTFSCCSCFFRDLLSTHFNHFHNIHHHLRPPTTNMPPKRGQAANAKQIKRTVKLVTSQRIM